jgi:repressor LexA
MGRTPTGQTRHKVFEFMRGRLLAGQPPTVREVQSAFGFRAVQTAREHLEALVEDGLLAKDWGKSRGYRLPELLAPREPLRMVPLLGRVQAGPLSAAIEDHEGYLAIPSRLPEAELFALHVRGDSMEGAAILANDIVIARRQPSADSGDIIVARVGDEATVKRLWRRGRRIELRAENPRYAPIVPSSGEISVLGKVIEVRRYLDHPPLVTPTAP